jgi:hypothetical protein
MIGARRDRRATHDLDAPSVQWLSQRCDIAVMGNDVFACWLSSRRLDGDDRQMLLAADVRDLE